MFFKYLIIIASVVLTSFTAGAELFADPVVWSSEQKTLTVNLPSVAEALYNDMEMQRVEDADYQILPFALADTKKYVKQNESVSCSALFKKSIVGGDVVVYNQMIENSANCVVLISTSN